MQSYLHNAAGSEVANKDAILHNTGCTTSWQLGYRMVTVHTLCRILENKIVGPPERISFEHKLRKSSLDENMVWATEEEFNGRCKYHI